MVWLAEPHAIDLPTDCQAIEILPKDKKVKPRNVKIGEVTDSPSSYDGHDAARRDIDADYCNNSSEDKPQLVFFP